MAAQLTPDTGARYNCKTCGGTFIIPQDETAVCCPICRMNRVHAMD